MSKNTTTKQVNTKIKGRSKRYSANFKLIQDSLKGKDSLSASEAVDLLFKTEKPNLKTGASVELNIKFNIDPTKSDQLVRSSVVLPHGSGKKVTVAAFVSPENEKKAKDAGADIVGGAELIEKIKKDGQVNFDKAVAQPEMMKLLPGIARILGVAGVMPNPKTGTVGDNIEEMVKEIKAGKVDYKNDKSGGLNLSCGKINGDFTVEKVAQNIEAILESLDKAKPATVKKKLIKSVYIATTFGPGIKLAL